MPLCILFDLDGTLVDSEALGCQALLEFVPPGAMSLDEAVRRYRGRKLADIVVDLQAQTGWQADDGFEPAYRARVAELFAEQLQPMPGVTEMLESLRGRPICIASSAPRRKIVQALHVTGLAGYFGDRLFSAYDVGRWKPDPGLFLHAAEAMGFEPDDCVVVEDSEVGLEAATRAGMHSIWFRPGEAVGSGAVGSMRDVARLVEAWGHGERLPGL